MGKGLDVRTASIRRTSLEVIRTGNVVTNSKKSSNELLLEVYRVDSQREAQGLPHLQRVHVDFFEHLIDDVKEGF